jgi:hypothetical protein
MYATFGIHERKNLHAKPRYRREDNNKMDLKETGYENMD